MQYLTRARRDVAQCNVRDITERGRLEKLIQEQASSLADLHRRNDEFLAMLSHELRNPLAPMANALQLLRLEPNESPLQRQARGIIGRQLTQLTGLVDELMEVSRITTGRVRRRQETLTCNSIVERAIEAARPVIVNLLTNTTKCTPNGGRISVSVQVELHGGSVQARSALGHGSELVIRLPLVTPFNTPPSRTPVSAAIVNTQRHRLLVVDDNADTADPVTFLLTTDGHDVRTAYSGPAGLDMLIAHRPAVAFLDLGLPDLDGLAIATRVRANPKALARRGL